MSARVGAGAAAFTNEILPRVSAADGFVGGYWLDPVDSEGFGFILFETAEQARRATPAAIHLVGAGGRDADVRRVAVAIPG